MNLSHKYGNLSKAKITIEIFTDKNEYIPLIIGSGESEIAADETLMNKILEAEQRALYDANEQLQKLSRGA